MKWHLLLGMFLIGVCCGTPARGFELLDYTFGSGRIGTVTCSDACCTHSPLGGCVEKDCTKCGCCDDYCPKPCPKFCLPRVCGCRDDYCQKKCPCFCLPRMCGCCDDYCPKKCPCIRLPQCCPGGWYRCPLPKSRCMAQTSCESK